MPLTKNNLKSHELIGLHVEVLNCSDPEKEGISGEVLDETRDTIRIGEKEIAKQNCQFLFKLPSGEEVQVSGKDIRARPEDRID